MRTGRSAGGTIMTMVTRRKDAWAEDGPPVATPSYKKLLAKAIKACLVTTGYTMLRLANRHVRLAFVDFDSSALEQADPLVSYARLLARFDDKDNQAMDKAHIQFIIGLVSAMKPQRVLELGIGSGFLTNSLIYALNYNQAGRLTSVDNWHDTAGREPDIADEIRKAGV